MKILHVIATLHKGGGGTSEVIPRLCRALKAEGHEVKIACLGTDDYSVEAEKAREFGVEIECGARMPQGPLSALGWSQDFVRQAKSLVQWADVIHLHGLWMAPPWIIAWEAIRQGKPYVLMPHGFLEPARLQVSKWKKRVIGALIERNILKHARAVVTTSDSETYGVRKYGVKNEIHVMPIGLDFEKYRMKAGPVGSNRTLLYFSRITPIKGLDMLAEAWGRVRPSGWKLLVVGPDDRGYTEEIKKVFEEKCESGSYEFRGPVFGEDKYKLLESVDAFILPTRSENWSIAVAEAMASGLPVICTKGAPWECLRSAKAGWWCDISVEGIVESLQEMVLKSDEERRKMGENGRKWVKENLDWNRIAKKMISFYTRLAHGNLI